MDATDYEILEGDFVCVNLHYIAKHGFNAGWYINASVVIEEENIDGRTGIRSSSGTTAWIDTYMLQPANIEQIQKYCLRVMKS